MCPRPPVFVGADDADDAADDGGGSEVVGRAGGVLDADDAAQDDDPTNAETTAVDESPLPPLPIRATIVCMLGNMAHFYSIASLFSYSGFLCVDLGWTATVDRAGFVAGFLGTALTVGRLPTAVLWGFFADRYGRRPGLLLSISWIAVGNVVFGTCRSLRSALIARFVFLGMLNGWVSLIGPVVGELAGPLRQNDINSYVMAAGALTQLVGPAAAALLYGRIPRYPALAPSLLGCAIAVITVTLGTFWLPETKKKSADSTNAASEGAADTMAAAEKTTTTTNNADDVTTEHGRRSGPSVTAASTKRKPAAESPRAAAAAVKEGRGRWWAGPRVVVSGRRRRPHKYSPVPMTSAVVATPRDDDSDGAADEHSDDDDVLLHEVVVDDDDDAEHDASPAPDEEDQPPPPMGTPTVVARSRSDMKTGRESSCSDAALRSAPLRRNGAFILGVTLRLFTGLVLFAAFDVVPLWAISSVRAGGLALSRSHLAGVLTLAATAQFAYNVLAMPRVMRRLGQRASLRAAAIGGACAAALMPIVGSWVCKAAYATQLVAIAPCVMTYYSCAGMSFTAVSAVLNNSVDDAVRGRANGLATMLEAVGKAAGPTLGATAFALSIAAHPGLLGAGITFWALAGLLAACAAGTFLLPARVENPGFLESRGVKRRDAASSLFSRRGNGAAAAKSGCLWGCSWPRSLLVGTEETSKAAAPATSSAVLHRCYGGVRSATCHVVGGACVASFGGAGRRRSHGDDDDDGFDDEAQPPSSAHGSAAQTTSSAHDVVNPIHALLGRRSGGTAPTRVPLEEENAETFEMTNLNTTS